MDRAVGGGGESGAGRSASRWALASALCVLGFWGVGLRYAGFRIAYGLGVQEIHPAELGFLLWLLCLGLPAVYCAARALEAGGAPRWLLARLAAAGAAPGPLVALGTGLVLAGALAVRHLVLLDAPVADDESTYVFIARTLLEGRVVNPSPGDAAFFRNQFVVLDDASWYGKYPLGQPAALALGEALGLRALVVPLLTAASFALCFAVGRRALPDREALLGTLLLLLSPQFLFTGATQLSQPASGLCMLLGLWSLLRLDGDGRLRWAWLAGSAFGCGILVRPLPGALFPAVAGIWVLLRFQGEPVLRQAQRVAAGLVPLGLACGAILAVQQAQTGDPTRSGYDAYHGAYGGFFHGEWIAASVAGSLVRQNAWLFGWPLSFAFLPFARRGGRPLLLWGMIAAEYAYRVILPKTVVASTGPIYVAEIVPLLALLSASGAAGAARWLAGLGVGRARERVAAALLAAVLVGAVTFLPVQVRNLRRSGAAWQAANRLLDEAGAGRALVFADTMVDPAAGDSWAYFPPNPSPDLDDARIFVRIPAADDAPQRAREVWLRRFPDRSAWLFRFESREPVLRQLGRPLARSEPSDVP